MEEIYMKIEKKMTFALLFSFLLWNEMSFMGDL